MDTPHATVAFPARDFTASVNAWTSVFGAGPAFSSSGQQTVPGEADVVVFKRPDIEVGLTSLPWVDEPLLFLGSRRHRANPARAGRLRRHRAR